MFKTGALNSTANAYVDKAGVTPGTRLEADDRNIVQQELVNAVEGAGLTLNNPGVFTNPDQLLKACKALGPTNKNAIINGIGEINQRVTAFTLVKDEYSFDNPLHGPDRHEGMATGLVVTAGTFGVTAAANIGAAGKAFKFAGVTLTGTGILYHRYRMEAADAVKYKDQTISISLRVYHDVGSARDYTIFVSKADSADNFGSVTAISDSGAQSIESATASDLKYLAVAMGDCSDGVEVEIKIEAGAITTKNFELTELQFELGIIKTDFEYRNVGPELALCQRYYCKSYDQAVAPGTADISNAIHFSLSDVDEKDHTMQLGTRFPTTMRATPGTIALYDMNGAIDKVTMEDGDGKTSDIGLQGTDGFYGQGTNGTTSVDRLIRFHYTANSEL